MQQETFGKLNTAVEGRSKAAGNCSLTEVNMLMKTREDVEASCYYLPVKINGTSMCALIDNGATVSVITSRLVDKMKQSPVMKETTKTSLRGFGLASVAVVGEVSVNVEAEDLRATNVTLLVVPDDVTSQSLVFGLDFLVKHYMVVDTVKRELRYSPPNESSYAVKLQSRPGFEIQSLVRTSNEISIYPNERILIRAKLCDDSISDVVDGYVDPFCVVSNEGANLEVAYSVSSAKNGYVIVELMNLNPIKVTL
jgi:hypothetical protein